MSLRPVLNAVGTLERTICILAFSIMTLSLLADVIARKALQTGLVGATEIAVMAMIALSMAGIGVASDAGAHFRLSVLDSVFPDSMSEWVDRVAGLITSAFFIILLVLSIIMVGQSLELGDRTEILRVPIWVLQSFIVLAFATNALRYAIYALSPSLRPIPEGQDGAETIALEDK